MPIANVFGSSTSSSGGGDKLITNDLSAQINGSNTDFTTTEAFESGSLSVFCFFLRQSANEITELSAQSFRIATAPQSGGSVVVQFYPNS